MRKFVAWYSVRKESVICINWVVIKNCVTIASFSGHMRLKVMDPIRNLCCLKFQCCLLVEGRYATTNNQPSPPLAHPTPNPHRPPKISHRTSLNQARHQTKPLPLQRSQANTCRHRMVISHARECTAPRI